VSFAVLILGDFSLKEKYLIHWVRKFFEYRQQAPSLPWFEQLPLFLQNLIASDGYQDWQIRQADQAVRLYFSNFLMAKPSVAGNLGAHSSAQLTENTAIQTFRENMRLRRYSRRTENTYVGWIQQYLAYCRDRSPGIDANTPCRPDFVRDFLAHLAMKKNVSASTQNQAFYSLLTFFRLVFNTELEDLKNTVRARTRQSLVGVEATMISTHVIKDMRNPVASPLDTLLS
jgi:hypothetical protein